MTATATDAAGNDSPVSGALGVTIDSAVPGAPGVALANDTGASVPDGVTRDPTLSLTGIEAAPGTLVEYSLDGTIWTPAPPTAAEGSNTVQVRQTDVAGNVSEVSPFSFTLDTATPAAPGVALTNDTGISHVDGLTNDPTLSLSGVESLPGALVEYSLGGSTWTSASPTFAEGPNTVQVRQTDLAGNMSTPGSATFTLDTTADAGGDLAVAAGPDVVNAAAKSAVAFAVSGLDPDATAIVTFSDQDPGTADVEVTIPAGASPAGVADLTQLTDGQITVGVSASDAAGNTATGISDALQLATHLGAPVIASVTDDVMLIMGAVAPDGVTNDADLLVAGAADVGSSVSLYDGASLLASVAADPVTGAWSLPTGVLADGAQPAGGRDRRVRKHLGLRRVRACRRYKRAGGTRRRQCRR